jgi:hypothetical protein
VDTHVWLFFHEEGRKRIDHLWGEKHVQIGRIESLQKMAIRMNSRAMTKTCIKDIIVSSPSAISAVVHCWRTVAGDAVLSS